MGRSEGAMVRVMSNRYGRKDQPWLVTCALCAGSEEGGLLGSFMALGRAGVKGYARDWRTAQDYAARHALAHEQTRCTTCLHVPAEPINDVTGVNA